jgi:GH24 family phage-related lysozyme (muramidase)
MNPSELSDAGLQGIRASEALRLHAYPDPASPLANATASMPWGFKRASDILLDLPMHKQVLSGKPWTIGDGFTRYPDGGPVLPDDECSLDEAEVWLRVVAGAYERAVFESVTTTINQSMFDALVNMAYNIGVHAFKTSTLVKRLNEGKYIEAQREFMRWVRAGGKILNGLVTRRAIERAWFNDGIRSAITDPVLLADFNAAIDEDTA